MMLRCNTETLNTITTTIILLMEHLEHTETKDNMNKAIFEEY